MFDGMCEIYAIAHHSPSFLRESFSTLERETDSRPLSTLERPDAQQRKAPALRSRRQELLRRQERSHGKWFNKSSSSGEGEINTPVNVGGSAEFRDSVQERPVRSGRHNSFAMDDDDALAEMEQEQPSKVRSMMWSRPVVDGKELETRLQSYRVRDLELEVSDPEKRARVDPESDRYMAWLFFIVVHVGSYIRSRKPGLRSA